LISNRRWEEVWRGNEKIIVEWRVIQVCPTYEISRDGIIRKVKNKRVRAKQPDFRWVDDGNRKSVSVRKLRNAAWPELEAW
jgi:hypothetical protein